MIINMIALFVLLVLLLIILIMILIIMITMTICFTILISLIVACCEAVSASWRCLSYAHPDICNDRDVVQLALRPQQ